MKTMFIFQKKSLKNSLMKIDKKFLVKVVGFFLGVIFYLFDLIASNAEISSIDPTFGELLRNINYFILLTYGIIGFIIMYILIIVLNKLAK